MNLLFVGLHQIDLEVLQRLHQTSGASIYLAASSEEALHLVRSGGEFRAVIVAGRGPGDINLLRQLTVRSSMSHCILFGKEPDRRISTVLPDPGMLVIEETDRLCNVISELGSETKTTSGIDSAVPENESHPNLQEKQTNKQYKEETE
jgi:hypothetical protein